MPPSRYIRLTEEEDVRLREIEQEAPYFKPKVRLRAQVLRLSHRGSNVQTISAYTGRSRASIARDLDRWEQRGFEGLLDGRAPGNPPRITEEARTFMEGRLSEEERTWNATQLAEALEEESFGVKVTPEALSANTSAPWATRGSAPATCRVNHRTPMRNAKLPKSWRPSKKGSKRRGPPKVPR